MAIGNSHRVSYPNAPIPSTESTHTKQNVQPAEHLTIKYVTHDKGTYTANFKKKKSV